MWHQVEILSAVVPFLIALSQAAVHAEPVTLYVATNGNDAWSGRVAEPNAGKTDGPLASLTGARDTLRKTKTDGKLPGPALVQVRQGVYFQAEPLVLAPEDSGTWNAPVVYAGYRDEKPIITGGRRITGWKKEGHLWTAEIPEVKSGTWYFSALWVNGNRRIVARTPNEGFFKTAGKAPSVKDPNTGKDVNSAIAFQYELGDIKPWQNLEDAVVVVFHSWETSAHRIASIDEANRIVTFTGKAVWPFMEWEPHQRYYIESVFEALDQPGEWYLNRKTGILYYWPLEGENIETAEVIAPVAKQLVVINGAPAEGKFVDHITIEGLRLQHTDFTIEREGHSDPQAAYSVPAAVQATGARYCTVKSCEIAHIGTYGLWFRAGCKDNRAQLNHIHDMGAGGVRIGEGGDPANENEAAWHNWIDNNWIHDGGKIFRSGVGAWIGRSSYNTLSHNEISDIEYSGVSVGWSWGYAPSSANHNIIEYNHIHHIDKGLLSDMGGIYTLGIAPGTILRNNLIHDISSFLYGGWGIYPDEGSTDLLIENNVVYNCKTGSFHQHYGKENRVINNIFAFANEGQIIRTREEEHISFFFERNIVYFNNGRLFGSNWKNGNFRFYDNCYWDASNPKIEFYGGVSFEDWRAKGQDLRSIIADPMFVDAEHNDFRLKPESPAIALGFRPIDAAQAGLYGLAEWVDAPKKIPRD
jgi:hypothetical protein